MRLDSHNVMASKSSDNPASTRHPPLRFRSAGHPTHRAEQVPEHPHIHSLVPRERSGAVRDGEERRRPGGSRRSFAPARQGAGSRWQRGSPPSAGAGAARVDTRSRRAQSDTGAALARPVYPPRLPATPTHHAYPPRLFDRLPITPARNAWPSRRLATPARLTAPRATLGLALADTSPTAPKTDRKTGERQGTRWRNGETRVPASRTLGGTPPEQPVGKPRY